MIALEAVQLRRIAAEVLEQLGVGAVVLVSDVHDLTDGTWMIVFEDQSPDTRFPTFDIAIQQDWTREHAARELRLVLRNKLWICPLCQRRAEIRRLIDREVFRILCAHCGRFEIEHAVLDHLRQAYEARDQQLIEMLPRLSIGVRQTAGLPLLAADTWQRFAVNS